ncbi:glycoside hydrolase family 3 N-terminal domain-containing protein [Skermania piniformis]|uniref:beta-N-acetylhexosaminidase n=1 Tax=Skermania pinensis TaxID=39122 RepID=A0ABX8S8L9_9ACTN|nr:glycoside hydrolase family 3 N-terminal domain-containing protein [Skermania piniformis]QXQ13796.1 glycoside hydrolase family 3 protein [Skermania piniformis]
MSLLASRRPPRFALRRAVGVTALAFGVGLTSACTSASAPVALSSSSAPDRSAPTAMSAAPAGSGAVTPVSAPFGDVCGDTYLRQFDLRGKLAQLLTVGVSGPADALNVVRSHQVGGIFVGSGTDQALLTNGSLAEVKNQAKVPLMVTIDEEGGRVSRIPNLIGTQPSAKEVAATMSPQQAYEQEKARATKLRDLGITVDFAPVVDVSDQPDDTVIGDRSFSGDPNVVTQYADAYIRGLHDAGLGAVIKHFPGHGSASGDSHLGPVTTPPFAAMQGRDLVPFRNLIGSGAAVMVGHLDVPGLTAAGRPASISPEVMRALRTGLPYGALPFNGVIFTDDLSGMAAITDRMGVPAAVEAALVAGADDALWISTDAVPAVLDQLTQAVAAGRLSEQQVDESVLRVGRFKNAVPC